MKIRKALIISGILLGLTAVSPSSTQAAFFTMDFTNSTFDLGLGGAGGAINLTNQYDPLGLNFVHAFRYNDTRDPWGDTFGISNGFTSEFGNTATLGTVQFNELTDSIAFDFWTINAPMHVEAFDQYGNVVGSYASGGAGSGQAKIVATGIKFFEFHNSGGFVQMSNLSYDRTNVNAPTAVPEPASMALFGLGLVGMGAVRRFKKRSRS